MTSPNDSVLAWSKTIDGVKFRAFAFPSGCGAPDCETCSQIESESAGPVWAVYMRPRPLEDEELDEWCLCLLALAPDELDPDDDPFTLAVEHLSMTDEDSQKFWRKATALIGIEWTTLVKHPYAHALKQKSSLDEVMSGGLVGRLVSLASVEQLREVRDAKRRDDGKGFGEAFGKLFWQLVGQFRRGS